MKITTNKAVTILMLIMLIPFILISTCTFFYIKNTTEENFISTMTRVTENTSQGSIDHQVSEIKFLLQSIVESLSGNNIDNYLSAEHTEVNSIIPSLINSTIFFRAALISDLKGHYHSYPETIKLVNFHPMERPWYPKCAIKDEFFFSKPYVALNKNQYGNDTNKSIAVSMNIFNEQAILKGNVALKLDLKRMSEILQHKVIPFRGQFRVVARDGSVIMHANANEIFTSSVPLSWIEKATELHGYFIDYDTGVYVFYRTYNNPDWIAFTTVSLESYHNVLHSALLLLFATIATCIIIYLIIMLLCRIYFKQLLHMLFMNIHGIEIPKESATFENLTCSMRQKHKENEKAENISLTDSLTLLGTRRKFDRDIKQLIDNNTSFHFAIIDLDNFKTINDTYGHHTGDLVLKFVSQAGLEAIANLGSLYRFGGEEITVIFQACSYAESYNHLEQWRLTVQQRKWREENLHVSFSCGLATWLVGETAEQLLEKADKLLYIAKRKGKNCIIRIED